MINMKKWIIIWSLALLGVQQANAQHTESIPFESILQKISAEKGIVVLNLWATWCKPCVTELPHFQKLQDSLAGANFQVWLGSADLSAQVKNVAPFLAAKEFTMKSFHISDAGDSNWINKADPSFSGAIPATIVYKDGVKVGFHEGAFNEEELFAFIAQYRTEHHEHKEHK